MHIEGISGKLDINKRRREIIPALLGNALLAEDELHIAMQLQFDEQLPLVMSFYEYYRFLDQFVTHALAAGVADKILVRVKMPSTIALPSSLLDKRVALFHELEVESQALTNAGIPHLNIDANFKLYSWSAGDNQFEFRYVNPQGHTLPFQHKQLLHDMAAKLPANFDYFSRQTLNEEKHHA